MIRAFLDTPQEGLTQTKSCPYVFDFIRHKLRVMNQTVSHLSIKFLKQRIGEF